jgi:hypothetical protein
MGELKDFPQWKTLRVSLYTWPSQFGMMIIKDVEVLVPYNSPLTAETFDQDRDDHELTDEEVEKLDEKARLHYESVCQ